MGSVANALGADLVDSHEGGDIPLNGQFDVVAGDAVLGTADNEFVLL